MLVCLLSFVLGSEDGHIPTFWPLLYSAHRDDLDPLVLLSLRGAGSIFWEPKVGNIYIL